MDLNREILGIISGLENQRPYSFIRSEVERYGAVGGEYIKVRRILREWVAHFRDVHDETNHSKIERIILLVGGNILDGYLDKTKRCLYIPREKLHQLVKEYGSDLTKIIIDKIRRGEIDFPFKKYSITETELRDTIDYIKSFTMSELSDKSFELPDIKLTEDFLEIWKDPLPLNGRYAVFIHNDTEYERIDYVTDYFTEPQRMNSVRVDQIPAGKSPYSIWREGLPIVSEIIIESISQVLSGGDEVLTPKLLRDTIFEFSKKEIDNKIRESTQFKVSLAISVLKKFLPDLRTASVLDISAGWGDRLIAAASCNVANYVACDPNTSLKDGHRKIIETFVPDGKDRFKIIYEPFETAELPAGIDYDLIFTSPPFFDLEMYTDEATQSYSVNNRVSANAWLVNFLFKSLEKAWSVLKMGGIMAIHITDTPSLTVCEPMILFSSWKLRGCNYCGVLGSLGGAGRVRPIWIFQKTSSSPHSRAAERVLKNKHRDVYDLCK